MITSLYIRQKTYRLQHNDRRTPLLNVFSVLHDDRSVIRFAFCWIVVAALIYLVAMYFIFGLGIALQEQSTVAKDLTESNIIAELNLQQRQTEFVRNNADVLQSMQKISDMRYILPTDTAVSRIDISDQSNQ